MYRCRRTGEALSSSSSSSHGFLTAEPDSPPAQVSGLATAVAPVARALYSGLHRLAGDPLAVLGQTQPAHEVDEAGGEVQLAAKLAGSVVVGEGVVVVVESFTWTQKGFVCFSQRFFITNNFQNVINF